MLQHLDSAGEDLQFREEEGARTFRRFSRHIADDDRRGNQNIEGQRHTLDRLARRYLGRDQGIWERRTALTPSVCIHRKMLETRGIL